MIKKIPLSQALNKIKDCNPEFYKIVKEISSNLPKEQKYLYQADFEYGERVINTGNFVAFEWETENFRIKNEFNTKTLSTEDIKKDLGFQKGIRFPLSIVTKGTIEIFHRQEYIKDEEEASNEIPLKLLRPGAMFGTWNTIDQILNNETSQIKEDWHGVAGRECFVTFFKDYNIFKKGTRIKKSRLENYLRIFQYLFDIDEKDKTEVIESKRALQLFIRNNVEESETSFLCFPIFYFEAIENYTLLKYLFKQGWNDKNAEREMYWENLMLKDIMMETLNGSDVTSFNTHFINHLIKISQGKHFYLKPVSLEDKIEYVVFEKLVEKLNKIKIEDGCLKWNSNEYKMDPIQYPDNTRKPPVSVFQIFHPLFLFYDIGWDNKSKGFTFLRTPPLMNHNFIDPSKKFEEQIDVHLLNDSEEDVSSIIDEFASASEKGVQLQLFKYKRNDEKNKLADFMNDQFGYFAKSRSSFNTMKVFNEGHELFYLSPSRNNIPNIFKEGTVYISNNK